jgi:hypothetical protein
MKPKKSADEIASQVFKSLPHINQVWVDETTQHHYLHNRAGGVLIERTKQIKAEPALNTGAAKPKESKTSKKKTKWQ